MKYKKTAFTLIELLVVIVIIGILATIGTATFNGHIKKGNTTKMLLELEQLYDVLERHSIVNQGDPNTLFFGDFNARASGNYNLVPQTIMPLWEADGFETYSYHGYSGMTQMFRKYIEPGSIITVFGSGGNDADSSDDNDFAILGWGDGFGTFDATKSGVIIVGSPRMRDAVKQNLASFSESSFQSVGYLNPPRILFRYLCSPLSVYTVYLQGEGASTYAATGNEDRWIYSAGGFTNNPICPY